MSVRFWFKDAPEIFSGLVDSYEPRGPFGAKEIGEGGILPVLGSVAHAVAEAAGVWITDLPSTPEMILKAVREKRATDSPVSLQPHAAQRVEKKTVPTESSLDDPGRT